ncbi:MAG: hypothetical protein CVU14_03475 [Bacteroidetes bacterium HGW-Bacteroidetes-9]|nr:MAG: hypothetical protein CVU14_03475 [Bacteroidetes bacterium HGW-Bacteroidetes-9]
MRINLKANEVVIKATDTLHTSDSDQTKGKLIMTNQRIYFKTLQHHDDHKSFEILPGEIRDILFYNVMRIIPRGLELITSDGRRFRFAMKKRKEWCRQIALMG